MTLSSRHLTDAHLPLHREKKIPQKLSALITRCSKRTKDLFLKTAFFVMSHISSNSFIGIPMCQSPLPFGYFHSTATSSTCAGGGGGGNLNLLAEDLLAPQTVKACDWGWGRNLWNEMRFLARITHVLIHGSSTNTEKDQMDIMHPFHNPKLWMKMMMKMFVGHHQCLWCFTEEIKQIPTPRSLQFAIRQGNWRRRKGQM